MKNQNEVIEYTDKKGKIRVVENDGKNNRTKGKKKKLIISAILILLVAMTAVFVYCNSDMLNGTYIIQWVKSDVLGINKGAGYPVPIVGNTIEKNNTAVSGRYFSYISDTTFNMLNSTAGEISSVQHGYASPVLRCSGDKILTYDLGGTAFSVESSSGTQYKGNCEDKIFCADISQSGVYGIAHETSGFLSNVQIYDKNNNFLYSYKMSEYYAVNMRMMSDGTGCAVAGVSTNSGKIDSKIYILNFKQEKPVASFSFEDDLIFDINFIGNGKLACVGDSAAHMIDISQKKTSDFSFEGKTVSSYRIKADYGIALSLSVSKDGKECILVYIDQDGQKGFEKKTELSVTDLDVCSKSKKMAVYSRGNIYFYSPSGELISTTECSKDIKSITVMNDSTVYTTGVSEINCINVTH